jgi:SAM-dependent methyltransferase
MKTASRDTAALTERVRAYWNERIHDLEVVTHPVGTAGFFEDLDAYRFEKLHYLPKLVDFAGFSGKRLLDIGCGAGIDLVRFAKGGAVATGVDLSGTAVDLARRYAALEGLAADLRVMDGAALDFPDASFDAVYAHGVLQYAPDAAAVVREAHRVLRPGGVFIAMVYNRNGWLYLLSKRFKVKLEHEDAPVLDVYTAREFRELLSVFPSVRIVPERFPVRSKLHQKGLKAFLFNRAFVTAFNALPRPLVRRYGWHLMAFASK